MYGGGREELYGFGTIIVFDQTRNISQEQSWIPLDKEEYHHVKRETE